MRMFTRSRVAGVGAALALALTLAPTALAAKSGTVPSGGGKIATTPVTTSGSVALTSCVPGGSGTAKWSVGTLELNVAIPSLAGQPVSVDARYNTGVGALRVKSVFTLDAGGKATVKLGTANGVPTTGGPALIDVVDLTPAGNHLLSSDPATCGLVPAI
jgi:hypothetical protein